MASFFKDVFRALTDRLPFAKAEGPTEWLAPDPADAALAADAPFPGVGPAVERTTPAVPERNVAATRTVTKSPTAAQPTVVLEVDVTLDIRRPAADRTAAVNPPATAVKPSATAAAVKPEPSTVAVEETVVAEAPVAAERPAPRTTAARKAAVSAAAGQPARKSPAPVAAERAESAAGDPAGQPASVPAAADKPATQASKPVAKRSAPAAKKSAPAAKPAAARKPAAKKAAPAPKPAAQAPAATPLPVKDGEQPWSEAEVAELREELARERQRLQQEIAAADAQLAEMLRDSGDGAVDDQADAGSRTLEREQELSLAAGSAEMLEQVDHALRRLDEGAYGICESCGKPIGKLRLQAFPRATMCLACKEQQERR